MPIAILESPDKTQRYVILSDFGKIRSPLCILPSYEFEQMIEDYYKEKEKVAKCSANKTPDVVEV